MGIFSSIKSAIWGSDEEETVETKAAAPAPAAAPAAPVSKAISEEEMAARISQMPNADKFNWQTSIVDLMKLLNLDSSYGNRKELAGEVGIDGYSGSAEDNIALPKAVMTKLAEAGGIVTDDLKD